MKCIGPTVRPPCAVTQIQKSYAQAVWSARSLQGGEKKEDDSKETELYSVSLMDLSVLLPSSLNEEMVAAIFGDGCGIVFEEM